MRPFFYGRPKNRKKCRGKICYDKKGAITAKNKRWNDDHVPLRIYDCPDCNGWHLTHKRAGKRYRK